jgi:hypothetical protein
MFCLISYIALFAAAGCGYSTPYGCVRVSGKVTYDDGSPIPADEVRLIFYSQTPPVDPKMPPRKGMADADKTGKFDFATTFINRDGIIVGEHKVILQCIRKGQLARSLIPPEYGDAAKTPLKVRSGDSPFDLKVPKPGRSAKS